MAWFRRMGVEQVAYHEATVVGREDDHPGQALDYYGSRGETPLRWGGAGAASLGLEGEVTPAGYRLAFGPGGFRDPLTGQQLVRTKRPGFELVVAAHKSLSLLGVVGRADEMHAILDGQTAATMGYLEGWAQSRGGRRGRAAVATPTSGLVYAVTRHGTSREGDPHAHDHVLVANVCEMRDTKGGYKALKSGELRDRDEAATMVGRLHSAAKAVELGYAIETDQGRSGRARDWRIVGISTEVCEVFSKRSDAIADYLEEMGYSSYRARNVAARRNRPIKRGTGTDQLMGRWIAELETHGWTLDRLAASLDGARQQCRGLTAALTDMEIDRLAAELLDPEGEFLARWKVFDRPRLVAEIAPLLYGHHPAELDRVVDRVLASEVVPLIGIAGASDQPYTAAAVLATEHTITYALERFTRRRAPVVARSVIEQVTAAKQTELGRDLSAGQRRAVDRICWEGRAIDVIVGVAGSGKTTALDVAARALEAAGHRVLGTATSGQAARTLDRHARIPSGTVRSLLWRLDHGQVTLDQRAVLVLDEASLTADIDLARLLLAVNRAGGKLVIVGDPRQLAPVGPGGALQALVDRHPDVVTVLDQNLRQRDPAERAALHDLRAGNVHDAVSYYATNGRIRIAATRTETLAAMVDAWAADTAAGHGTLMLAWRRSSVADLNRLARVRAEQGGWLSGPDLATPDGRSYAVGDPVVTLAPNDDGQLVTSQRGRVVAIDQRAQTLTMATDGGRRVVLKGEALDQGHLNYGYALTVHREQGATADRTHYLAEGGGRELAYVAMSRARGPSIVHAVADHVGQAIEDITYDWSLDRNQQWITRTATAVGVDPAIRALPEDPDARRARLLAELETLEHHAPPDVTAELAAAHADLDRLRQSRDDLVSGTGRWHHTPAGQAARDLDRARHQRQHAEHWMHLPHVGRRERHRWRRVAQSATRTEARAQRDWIAHSQPAVEQLDRRITRAEHRVAELETHARFRQRWLAEHPELDRRLQHTQRELRPLDNPTDVELDERLKTWLQPCPDRVGQAVERADIKRIRQHLDRLQHSREIEPPGLSL